MRALPAVLLLLAGLLLCAGCEDGGAQGRACRINAPPEGSEPLDLGAVTLHSDRSSAETRAIREGIAAVSAYHGQIGIGLREPLHVHSYAAFFDTYRHMVEHGRSLNAHDTLQTGYSISTDWTHDGPPATGEPRLWLARADRLSAATALAAYLLRRSPRYDELLDIDPLAVRGLAAYVAYRALERAGFGSVERCLAAAAATWRESGQGWLEAPVAAGLTTDFESNSSVDDRARLLDAADWNLPYTMRLFGALALDRLRFDPALAFAHDRRLTQSAPELIGIDREALEGFLRSRGVIPPPSDPIDVVIRWNSDALGDRAIGAIRLEQRHRFGGAISKRWETETLSFAARKVHETKRQSSVPPGTYNLLLEIDGQQLIAGVFAITPTGIRPAASDAVLQRFEITADNHELRIKRVPPFVELELGSDLAETGDLGWRSYRLCSAGESFIWCWDPKGALSSWPASYTVPAGRYALHFWGWIPGALVDISDADARIVEQYRVEIPSEDSVITTDAELAFERMDGGWRLAISERAGASGRAGG